MRKWLSTILLILSFSASSQTQPELVFAEDSTIGSQMEIARAAFKNKDYTTAIVVFNNVLLSPTNRFTQEAQARIGAAYEATGKPAKAMAEYRAYITMYPKSDILESMKRRLLILEIANPPKELSPPKEEGPRIISESKTDATSSVYYIDSGKSASILTNIHASGNFKNNEYTTKVTVRGSTNTELNVDTKYKLNIATVDVIDTYRDWELKIGRQNPEYGVLSKFDGVSATLGYNQDIEYTFVLGKPSISQSNSDRSTYGAHLHYNLDKETNLTFYYNLQTADGLEERSAFGADVRYFKDSISGTVGAEYDLAYRQLNHVKLHLQQNGEINRSFFLFDKRKSPVLYADKALKLGLFGPTKSPYSSVSEALEKSGFSREELYDFIVSETSVATSVAFGGGKRIGQWDVGGDIQYSHMTGTVSEPGSSSNYSITGNVFNQEIIKGHSFNGILSYSDIESGTLSMTLLDSTRISKVRVDTTLRITNRNSQLFSVATYYKITEDASMEVQFMVSRIKESIDKTLIMGFKYDF